ncbi:hypothetical protein FN846DRAFT_889774 [Sphaerosporella brunnea]|uniref:Uncharacterized protein n=1 Tax=Sphaerosporella brunnea TaxID=1250544 RepID=A0A5J5EYM3_9PEZI|nr:hypothetical protein FN846DRAFT_889774 [Sphaerosporella brunnea]
MTDALRSDNDRNLAKAVIGQPPTREAGHTVQSRLFRTPKALSASKHSQQWSQAERAAVKTWAVDHLVTMSVVAAERCGILQGRQGAQRKILHHSEWSRQVRVPDNVGLDGIDRVRASEATSLRYNAAHIHLQSIHCTHARHYTSSDQQTPYSSKSGAPAKNISRTEGRPFPLTPFLLSTTHLAYLPITETPRILHKRKFCKPKAHGFDSAEVPALRLALEDYFLDHEEWLCDKANHTKWCRVLVERLVASQTLTTNKWFKKVVELGGLRALNTLHLLLKKKLDEKLGAQGQRAKAAAETLAADRVLAAANSRVDATDQEMAVAEIRTEGATLEVAAGRSRVGHAEHEMVAVEIRTGLATREAVVCSVKLLRGTAVFSYTCSQLSFYKLTLSLSRTIVALVPPVPPWLAPEPSPLPQATRPPLGINNL